MQKVMLCNEDFSSFPIGEFPYDSDHSAMGEYQYVEGGCQCNGWLDQVYNHTYRGAGPTWIITEKNGKHYMESMRIEKGRPHRMFPTLETGNQFWRDYTVSVAVRRFSQKGMAGLVFNLNHSCDTLVFYLEGHDRVCVSYRHKEEVIILRQADYAHNCDDEYTLCVVLDGEKANFSVNGVSVFEFADPLFSRGGKAGISADCPTAFTDFMVSVTK
ncbi:MAG: hypothetical protein LUH19_05785, partial [Lachnospiraceae bacterium]|nr:hypothetical protein [Lachnospiraceae bacterium]